MRLLAAEALSMGAALVSQSIGIQTAFDDVEPDVAVSPPTATKVAPVHTINPHLAELEALRAENHALRAQVSWYVMYANSLVQQIYMMRTSIAAAGTLTLRDLKATPTRSTVPSEGSVAAGSAAACSAAATETPTASEWSSLPKGDDGRPSLAAALAMADREDAANYGKMSCDEVLLMSLEARVDAEEGWDKSNEETFLETFRDAPRHYDEASSARFGLRNRRRTSASGASDVHEPHAYAGPNVRKG
mmetsp:Transcript_5046/g.6982  ORF Transcript_5046/g.6982 Transcript_5046/m.6982 type:complete len:247 (-) Transcript_5046:18-758(-)